jgi:peptidoglycan/xylan/chitin deacetylase (PgdA/CDA1 family)
MRATLTYHSIDGTGSPISVSPEAFEGHARWLESGRVHVTSLDDVADGSTNDAVAVTFDDGFANVMAPVQRLRSAGLPVTVFAVTGRVGSTNAWGDRSSPGVPTLPLLGWSDLERLASLGVTIAAHSRTHAALSTVSDAALEDELAGCLADLERRLGIRPRHFAYPYGDLDDRVAERARAHYAFAHTTECVALDGASDPWRLPRVDMFYFRAADALSSWGQAGFARRLAWIAARRLARHILIGGPQPGGRRRWTR